MSNNVNIEGFRQTIWDGCEAIMDVIDYLHGLAPCLRRAILDNLDTAPASEAALALLAAQGLFLDRLAVEVEAMQRASAG